MTCFRDHVFVGAQSHGREKSRGPSAVNRRKGCGLARGAGRFVNTCFLAVSRRMLVHTLL